MGEETTLLDLLPGVHNLKAYLSFLQRDQAMIATFPSHFTITHVLSATMVVAFLIFGALTFRRAMQQGGEQAIVPPAKFSLRLLFEMFADAVYSVAESVM